MIQIYSSPHVDYNRLVLEAVISKGTHKLLAERSWLLSDSSLESLVDVSYEISGFLDRRGQSSGLTEQELVRNL